MKKNFILPIVISFAMICACQKQDSAAEAQLAQRKAELDAREKALDEREKAVGEWEKAMTKFRAIPSDLQSRKPAVDPEQAKAEREKRLQQLPPELRALVPNPAQVESARLAKQREAALQGQTPDPAQAKADRERRIQQLPPELQALIRDRSLLDARTAEKGTVTEDRAERLRRLEEERRKKMSDIASPNADSSDTQPGSPSPSPTPE
jgi:chromosome segregation ATPase